ncbi:pirin family protein [Cupriavidus sp. 2TAF22]|uniref:pirin family protein n=1 Tax=unclassified Cupriavidus TaxID=2640874 RepID=UPI003F91393C
MKKVLGIYGSPQGHWVGDGFPVRTLFSQANLGNRASPFLMLDYAGPAHFAPTFGRRGVGEHPHRGFETVTIVYQGELEHRDSTGQGGKIGPGDVQWMTAAAGILHEEYHSEAFARQGGTLEMVQLWVNLPAREKMSEPGYQTLLDANIPQVALPRGAGSVRVIAGEFGGALGPARTFTPIDVWDVRLLQGHGAEFTVPSGRNVLMIALHGNVTVNGTQSAHEAQLVVLEQAGTGFTLEADSDATILLLSGEPLDEPVVSYGPFVMNTQREIEQALSDYRSGQFGRIPASVD